MSTALAVGLGYPGGISAAVSDVTEAPTLCAELDIAKADSSRLDIRVQEMNDRLAKKEALIEELIAGRLTLREVSDRFFALSGHDETFLYSIRMHYPGQSDEVCTVRNVMDYTVTRVRSTGEQVAVMHRLHREYHEQFGHDLR